MTDCCVTIPTLNERANIADTIARVRNTQTEPWVVVVDDGSTDGTQTVVREGYADTPEVELWERNGDDGLASAIIESFQRHDADYHAVIDADGQHDPRVLDALFAHVRGPSDVAVASRHLQCSASGSDGLSPPRRLVSFGARLLAGMAAPNSYLTSDPMSGFFAVDGSVLDGVVFDPVGYKALLEILARCPVEHVADVPYWFRQRRAGTSNFDMQEVENYLRHLYRLQTLRINNRGSHR